MATLENVYHNFPLLAQQSGFNFQLPRGRVNWSEIENLDINEITERRNFELLEHNLVNVTNCNLEREYDFKILDKNFVKLFKLAQLGVDYLSYCEMYLDKCVVLLQEQLIASQDECELLKKQITKRKEVKRNQSENKTLSHQCEKCAKVFISDVYLKFHEKRRHSNTTTQDNFNDSSQKFVCNCQKKEENKKVSTFTQTLLSDEMTAFTQEKDDNNLKMQHLLKWEKLEQELEDLKDRFKKAESTIAAKTESPNLKEFHLINVPNSRRYNSMLMLLPSYLAHIGDAYCEINSDSKISIPEGSRSNIDLPSGGNSDAVNSKPLKEDMSQSTNESKISAEKKCQVIIEGKINSNIPDIAEGFQNSPSEGLECEKDNVDPKIREYLFTNEAKPLPPPRRLNKGIQEQVQRESEIADIDKVSAKAKEKTKGLNNHLRSTPVKEKLGEETEPETSEGSIENISEITKPKANSVENLQSKKSFLIESGSKSFIKKIVTRDSPSIHKLSKNFNKSLNTISNLVPFTEKEVPKKETNFRNLRTAMMEGLNNHLQRLGISSEWSGIPRKTMRQKLSAWKHERRFLSRENNLYPVIRQNIEEKIFQKLNKNLKRKKAKSTNKLNKQESVNLTIPEIQNNLFENKSELVKNKSCLIYDTDTDSESKGSVNFNGEEQTDLQKTIILEEISSSEEWIDAKNDKESNLLFSQAERSSLNHLIKESKPKSINSEAKLLDSDTESSFLKNFHKNFKEDELTTDKEKEEENFDKLQVEFSSRGKVTTFSQSILKDGEGFKKKPITTNQKKVLFAMYSKGVEEELSDDPTDDDLWSLKTDREKNEG